MAKYNKLPAIDYLDECFFLDPESGEIYWRERPQNHFPLRDYQYKIFNSAWAGKKAMVTNGMGYFLTCINGIRYKSHRIIYYIHYGIDPLDKLIDHKNENRGDNRPENLRLCTASENALHFSGVRKNNTHGTRGVTYKPRTGRWEAWAQKDGKRIYLGIHDDRLLAEAIAKKERIRLFGEFAEGI